MIRDVFCESFKDHTYLTKEQKVAIGSGFKFEDVGWKEGGVDNGEQRSMRPSGPSLILQCRSANEF